MAENPQSPKKLTTDQAGFLSNLIIESMQPDFVRFRKELNKTVRLLAAERYEHLEAMTCAYFSETGIPASEVTLIEESLSDGRIAWYFKRRIPISEEGIVNCPYCGSVVEQSSLPDEGALDFYQCINSECNAKGPNDDSDGSKWNAFAKGLGIKTLKGETKE